MKKYTKDYAYEPSRTVKDALAKTKLGAWEYDILHHFISVI